MVQDIVDNIVEKHIISLTTVGQENTPGKHLCYVAYEKSRKDNSSPQTSFSHLTLALKFWGFYCNRCGSDTDWLVVSCSNQFEAVEVRKLLRRGSWICLGFIWIGRKIWNVPWKATELGWLERLERLTCQATKKAEALKLLKDEAWGCCGSAVLGIWCGLCGTARKLSFRMLRERGQGKICEFCMMLVFCHVLSINDMHIDLGIPVF